MCRIHYSLSQSKGAEYVVKHQHTNTHTHDSAQLSTTKTRVWTSLFSRPSLLAHITGPSTENIWSRGRLSFSGTQG